MLIIILKIPKEISISKVTQVSLSLTILDHAISNEFQLDHPYKDVFGPYLALEVR